MTRREMPYRRYRRWLWAGLAGSLVCSVAQAEPQTRANPAWLKPDAHFLDNLERALGAELATTRIGGADWRQENTQDDAEALGEDILAPAQGFPPAPCLSTTFDKVHNHPLGTAYSAQNIEWLSPTGDGPCQTDQPGLIASNPHNGIQALGHSGALRQELVSEAQELLGIPYRNGGKTPLNGFDCSGFVYYAMQQIGVNAPRTAHDQYLRAARLDKDDLQPGDLVFFKTSRRSNRITHVGIYLGNDRFIHAPSHRKRVTISSLDERYWSKRFVAGGRMLPA